MTCTVLRLPHLTRLVFKHSPMCADALAAELPAASARGLQRLRMLARKDALSAIAAAHANGGALRDCFFEGSVHMDEV